MPLARGYPAPPLAVNGSDLVDTWSWRKVTLRGVNWFGFNNEVWSGRCHERERLLNPIANSQANSP